MVDSLLRIPEGESGLQASRLTEERLKAVIAWFSLPSALKKDEGFPSDVPALAKELGVGVRDIEKWRREPKVYEAVASNLRMAAIYMMGDVLWEQGQLAIQKRDTKAARFLAQVAKVLGDGGTTVEVHNTNVSNSSIELQALPDGHVLTKAAAIWAKVKEAGVDIPVDEIPEEISIEE